MAESLEPSLVDFFSDHSLFSIERVEVFTHRVSTRTEFLFVRMIAVEGEMGWGEASFNDLNGQVIVALRILADAIQGSSIEKARNYLADLPAWKYGRAYQIALSALEQAMADIQSQRLGLPFGALFGSPQRTRIPCYANINRGTTDRSPEGWAKRAQKAIDNMDFSELSGLPRGIQHDKKNKMRTRVILFFKFCLVSLIRKSIKKYRLDLPRIHF